MNVHSVQLVRSYKCALLALLAPINSQRAFLNFPVDGNEVDVEIAIISACRSAPL